jgi:hypothetical protein
MSLWLSIALTALALAACIPAAIQEVALHRTHPNRPRRTISVRTRAHAVIAFLVLIIIAQFLVFLAATNRL